MAITTRTATVVENASATSVTGTLPTGTTTGDYSIVAFSVPGSTAQFTGPSGWTLLGSVQDMASASETFAVYGRLSPPGNPVASTSAAAGRVTAITQSFVGVDQTTPIDVSAHVTNFQTLGQTTYTETGVTTVTDGAMAYTAASFDRSSVTPVMSTGGWTLDGATAVGGGRVSGEALKTITTAGATGSVVWTTTSPVAVDAITMMVALRPSTAVGPELGGAVPARTRTTAATHGDRRLYPQQRPQLADQTTPFVPLTPELQGTVPALAGRMAAYYDRREVPQQKDLRNALLVAAPANPADPLLFSAESMTAWATMPQMLDRSWRRPAPVPPATIDPAPSLAGPPPAQPWRRDPYPPQQRQLESDPSMLATAQLENELLGSADDLQRHRAWFTDRRLYPRQLVTYAVDLTTAELEGALLGGGTTAGRGLVPASHAPRWWMPQQPARSGRSPGLLDDAQLEGALLGGADVDRHRTWFVDRRLVPQQPARLADASGLAPDLTLGGLLPALVARWAPATHADRRLVPVQLVKWADVGVVPVTDPVLSGVVPRWVAQTPAFAADRREVPQQRLYVSDPLLLSTALLDELLGQADVARHQTWFTDRRQTVPQRSPLADQGQRLYDPTTAPSPRTLTAHLRPGSQPAQQRPGTVAAAPADPLAGAWGVLWQRWSLAVWVRVPARGVPRIALVLIGTQARVGLATAGYRPGPGGDAGMRTGAGSSAGHRAGIGGDAGSRSGPSGTAGYRRSSSADGGV